MMDRKELIALCGLLDQFLLDEDYIDPEEVESVDTQEVFSALSDDGVLRPSFLPEALKKPAYISIVTEKHIHDDDF